MNTRNKIKFTSRTALLNKILDQKILNPFVPNDALGTNGLTSFHFAGNKWVNFLKIIFHVLVMLHPRSLQLVLNRNFFIGIYLGFIIIVVITIIIIILIIIIIIIII